MQNIIHIIAGVFAASGDICQFLIISVIIIQTTTRCLWMIFDNNTRNGGFFQRNFPLTARRPLKYYGIWSIVFSFIKAFWSPSRSPCEAPVRQYFTPISILPRTGKPKNTYWVELIHFFFKVGGWRNTSLDPPPIVRPRKKGLDLYCLLK